MWFLHPVNMSHFVEQFEGVVFALSADGADFCGGL
jgi:hypothetical protein